MISLFLILLTLSSANDPQKDSACSFLVTDFLLKHAETIHHLFKGDHELDHLGVINQMAKDSFDKCSRNINEDQIQIVNLKGADSKYHFLVSFDPKSYLGFKVEPTYDFILKLKSLQIHSADHPHDL